MAGPQPVLTYSYEAYLALEAETQMRYEYYAGQVVAMAGGSRRHSLLATNFLIAIRRHVASGCTIYGPDVKLEITKHHKYYYPDLSLTCHPDDQESAEKSSINHPVLVAEVLSDTTESIDRTAKFQTYIGLPSLQYYVMVSQHTAQVEVYARQTHNFWYFHLYEGLEAVIEFPSLGFSITAAELYQGVTLDPVEAA
ncbi:MAG: Uma2 family endonuclease [Bacteroidia bacterium]|nr:Uma2 family endonuclease [Bacteroidia bacterium]